MENFIQLLTNTFSINKSNKSRVSQPAGRDDLGDIAGILADAGIR